MGHSLREVLYRPRHGFLAALPLEGILFSATLALGLVHAWAGRYAMNPDGMSYLDVGASFFRGDWSHAFNAYWSPLYPWMMGTVIGLVSPSARWEFPLVHAVNFAIFVVALLAFRFLLHTLLEFRRASPLHAMDEEGTGLPEWALLLVAYPIFWWTALELETIYDVSPDLAVFACVAVTAGLLLSLHAGSPFGKFALFGLVLGMGYWTKAILFPLGFVTLAVCFWWKRSEPRWRAGVLVAGVVFLLSSAPLIFALSAQKGRPTFGDSGKLAYAWFVSPATFWRNWQGEEIGSGTPVHPTRQLLRHPPLFEFDGPVVGTYPPWTDPSYWNEGLQPHFRLRPQLRALAGTLAAEARLLLRAQPALVAGILVLALLSGQRWWAGLRELWPLVAISGLGMALYLPILENDRYLGGFLFVLFLGLLAAAQCSKEDKRSFGYVAVAVSVMMALGTADYTVRIVTNHLAIPGSGPNSTWQDVVAAEQLQHMGARPGDKIAVIADGTGAYWAHLAKLRIVAEIMDTNRGVKEFWSSSEEQRQQVYTVLAQAHAKVVVSVCPLSSTGIPDGWEHIERTPYCVRPLPGPQP